MKTSELAKRLKKLGCRRTLRGAKHDEWYSPITGRRFYVPRHQSKEIPTGTVQRIMKDAGLE